MIPIFIKNKSQDNTIISNNGSTVTLFCNPAIMLDYKKKYTLSLVEADISWVSPNIISGRNNRLIFLTDLTNTGIYTCWTHLIPTGLYSLDELQREIDRACQDKVNESGLFKLEANTATSKIYIHFTSNKIKLSCIGVDNVLQVLGFLPTSGVLGPVDTANDFYEGDEKASLNNVSNIMVNCSIIHGSYINSTESNTLASILPDVEPYSLIQYRPNFLIKVPITRNSISQLTVNLTDQDGNALNFMGTNNNYELWHIRLVIEEEK